jgi:hypothetical protein
MAGNAMTNTAGNTIYGAQNMALGTGADAFNTQYRGMLEGQGNTASANNTLLNAYEGVQPLQQQAINNMVQSYYGAQGYNQRADQQYQQSLNQADPLNQAAIQQYAQGLGAANPVNYGALSQIGQSLEGAQPFQRQAQDLAFAGMQGISPGQIGGQQIGQFMSPYISSVLEGTRGMLDQQNQQAMSGQTGNAIRQGAFGGDRAGIAAASLAQQQQLANAQIYSGILNQGYGQALGAAQQQQGVNLSAEQANRAAIQQGAQTTLGIGQQGFGQGMTAAQQQAAMAQQLYAQQAGAGQNLAQIGQQIYGQQSGAGQNLAGLGQQQYGQGMGLSQAQLGAGQQQYAQGAQTAQQQAANAKQMYDMTAATAAHQQELAKLQFNIGSTTAAQQAALGQQTFGMGATTAQQQAANAQQTFGMGATTAQQQAALAQQGYTMGSGTAMNQANIGNMQFGQGAQTAQQQAALAQQVFGMQSQASQQRAALAQQQYAMGANTSQQMAALGAGRQGAALQGAQAQLAAGQMQQQTQQAGLQALYNQFLQQQSYPFQTAQFLANVAMGTGALSGNTTTTTQPGGFFSDERLKENVKEVGKTFDGQPIYSYNYKGGDKRQQIGLMAQEVEGKHPDAVGLAGGYKTVDYGKATEDAAKRGHFYSGGVASMGGGVNPGNYGEGFADGGMPMGGYDPALMQQILQNYNAMYGTLAQPGQPGMLGASTPGLGGIVPSANLPIPEMLQPADMPRAPESGLDRATQIADLATKGEQIYKGSGEARAKIKKAYDTYNANQSHKEAASGVRDYMSKNGDPTKGTGLNYGFAMGGTPYDTSGSANALNIPDEKKDIQTLKPGEMPAAPESGLDKTGKVVAIAATAAKVLPFLMAMNTGGAVGRKGYATDGEVEGLSDEQRAQIERLENPIGVALRRADPLGFAASKGIVDFPYFGEKYDTNKRAYDMQDKIQAAMVPGARNPTYGLQDKIQAAMAGAPVMQSSGLMPQAPAPKQRLVTAAPRQGGLAAGAPPAAVAAPPAAATTPAHAPNPSGLPIGTKIGDAFVKNIPRQAPVPMAHNFLTGQQEQIPQGLGGVLPTAAYVPGADEAVFAGKHPFLSGAKDYLSKSENVVPLLAGLAAMGTAPTRSLGVALASGVGAGAKSYMDVRKQQADIGETKARTGFQQAVTSGEQVLTQQKITELAMSGMIPQLDPNGNLVGLDGKKYSLVRSGNLLRPNQGASPSGAAPSPESTYSLLKGIGLNGVTSSVDRYNTLPQEAKLVQQKAFTDTQSTALAARDAIYNTNEWADAVVANMGKPLQSDALGKIKNTVASYYNAMLNTLALTGVDVSAARPKIEGLPETEIASKLQAARAFLVANGADQRSLGAMDAAVTAGPNSTITPQASLSLLADMYVNSKQQIDRANFLRDYEDYANKQGGAYGRNFMVQDALREFDQAHGPEYMAAKQHIKTALLDPNFKEAKAYLISGTPDQKAAAAKKIDQTYGAGMHEYILGI